MLLSKQVIFATSDLPTEDVDVPEWGGTVRLRTLTGLERDAFEASCIKGSGKKSTMNYANIRAKLVSLCAVDGDGKPLFDETDSLSLGKKSAPALDRLFSVCQRMNGLSDADVEELVKN